MANGDSYAKDIIDAVQRLGVTETIELGEDDDGRQVKVLSVPDGESGRELVSLKKFFDEWRTSPERLNGTAQFSRLDSFIEHTKRFMSEHSVLFAKIDAQPTLTSVLNYHDKEGNPDYGDHRGIYTFPLSKEWAIWKGYAEKKMDQIEFAEFIESNALDVMSPNDPDNPLLGTALDFQLKYNVKLADASELIMLSKGLTINETNAMSSFTNLSTGEVQFNFVTKHENGQGGPLIVPGGFVLAIPVFQEGKLYQIPVRLRYRKVDDKVKWFYSPHRLDRALLLACDEACAQAEDHTKLPLFHGTPEPAIT